jgi:AcrR family transcriptional regulator
MGRKHKAHDERRNEILDAAWELFASRGYLGTTVAAIIDKLGISKGTFYHYFDSKEQVLDAVTDRLSAEPLAELRPIVEDSSLRAGPKLNRYMEVARRSRLRRMDSIISVARVLYREENVIIRHKIAERLLEVSLPSLRSIIAQGVSEGCFQVFDAGEAALVVWHLSNTFADLQMRTLLSHASIESKVGELALRAETVVQSLERILGTEPGTISRPSPELFELFVRAVSEDDSDTA